MGKVTDVIILVYRESRGAEVRDPRFLKQFRGKTRRDSVQVDRDILNYSGATLSSQALARGVRKALTLFDYFFGANGKRAADAGAPPIMSSRPVNRRRGILSLRLRTMLRPLEPRQALPRRGTPRRDT
jgi:hypothetical protein